MVGEEGFCGGYNPASSLVIWDGHKAEGLTRGTQPLLRLLCQLRHLLKCTFFKNGILSSESVLRSDLLVSVLVNAEKN